MINRLIGRFAHLEEPENKKQEEYLRKIITVTIEQAEKIASQASWTPEDDALLQKMIEAKLTAEEIATRLGRPISSIRTRLAASVAIETVQTEDSERRAANDGEGDG
jgi:DNA-directed RNA polymerase specialized sigma24 family protein